MTAPAIPPADPPTHPRLLVLMSLTFATCALGWLFKAHCSFDGYWSGAEQYTTGCYSDAMPFWGGRAVDAGRLPYFQSRMEYPVLIGALIYLEGLLTRLVFGASAGAPDFLAVVAIVNGLFAMAVTRLLWGMGLSVMRLRAWALAPPLVLYVGHNWDMLAVLLAVMVLAAAQRARFPAASALAGLAAAAKFFPLLLLPLFALKPLADRRVAAVATMAAAAIGAWALVNAPVAALAWTNWAEFYVFSGTRSGTAASFWMLAQQFGWLTIDVAGVNRWSGILFLAGATGIVAVGWRAHRDRLWMLAAPVVAWFLLTSKVYSPQFDLWLYPLLLIGAPRLKPVAGFVIGDIIAYFAEFWLFAGMEGAWPADGQRAVLAAAAIRAAAMLWLIADSLRLPPPVWSHAPVD